MITGNLTFGMPFEAYRLKTLIPAMARMLIKDYGFEDAISIKARVNWGKWIVDCECGGAEFAWDEGWLMCQSCWNSAHKHKYRPVSFPGNRASIEQLLLGRPLGNRNWYPGESIAKLKAENAEHKQEML